MEKICKIVYFDEESVTDYVQIVAGGELENTMELLKSRDAHEKQDAKLEKTYDAVPIVPGINTG